MNRQMQFRFLFFLLFFLCGIFSFQSVHAQEKKVVAEKGDISQLVTGKQYRFVAQSATSQSGRTRQLTSSYFFTIDKDKLDVALPYFGTAYTAPIDPSEGGINFKTTEFEYNSANARKGGWEITIKIKNQRSATRANLSVSKSGWGTLMISGNDRQSISFYGYVAGIEN